MKQRRSERVVVNLEPTIAAAFRKLVDIKGERPPEYGRRLIIEDLKRHDLIDDNIIVKVTT